MSTVSNNVGLHKLHNFFVPQQKSITGIILMFLMFS